MEMIIDTCSLVSLAKQYLPLDHSGLLASFLADEISSGSLIILDSIQDECKTVSKGIALEKFPFLKDHSVAIITKDIVPKSPRIFTNRLNNNYCVGLLKNQMTPDEFENQKNEFLSTGDGRLILFLDNNNREGKKYTVITEESRTPNDGKLFKKLPLILDQMGIKSITVSEYLKDKGFYLEK